MKTALYNHWGRWILERATVVGFARQADLAKAVGCSRERVVKWGALANAPTQMRNGLDKKLAYALQITAAVLFTDWQFQSPLDAKRVLFHVDQLDFPKMGVVWWPEIVNVLQELMGVLGPKELEWLALEVSKKVLAQEGVESPRYAIFRQIMDRFVLMGVENIDRLQLMGVSVIRDKAQIEQFLKEHPEADTRHSAATPQNSKRNREAKPQNTRSEPHTRGKK